MAMCTYGHAKEALGGVATLYCSLQCGTANTKHLCEEINIFRAGSKLHLEVGKPSVPSYKQMCAWHMDHMVHAVLNHNSNISQYNSGFYLRMQTCAQKLHSLVHPFSPLRRQETLLVSVFPGWLK